MPNLQIVIYLRLKSGCSVFFPTAAVMVWLFLGSSSSYGDTTGNYKVRLWTANDGLPQSQVSCLAQTEDGYLWIGTWFGLVRFDGASLFSTILILRHWMILSILWLRTRPEDYGSGPPKV
jgi:hypothetical protein